MKEAQFQYKCRRCGCIDQSLCCGADRADLVIISTIGGYKPLDGGDGIDLFDIHHCSDGGIGVADLIGCEIVEVGGD